MEKIKDFIKNRKIFFVLFFIFLFIFLITSLLMNLSKRQQISNISVNNQNYKTNKNLESNFEKSQLENQLDKNDNNTYKNGNFKLKLLSEKENYLLNNDYSIKIDVLATIPDQNITAFDVIFLYNEADFDFLKAESSFPDFQIFPRKEKDSIILTGGKTLQSEKNVIFNNQKIVSIYLKPKKRGEFFFSLEKKLKNYSTKFINEKTEIFYPEVDKIKINVK